MLYWKKDMTEKIKILYGITKSNWGGAQKYVYDLATSLPKDKFEVTVLTGGTGILNERLSSAQIRNITLESLGREIKFWQDIVSFFKIINILRKERPDILHLNSSKMGFIGALAGRLTHVPKIIFTAHGWAFNEDRSPLQKKGLYWLHRLTIKLSHKTIAVSEQTKNQISKGDSIGNKISVIKNGLEKIDFLSKAAAREKIRSRLPVDLEIGTNFWLGTISELHKNKGLKYLIEAMHLLDMAIENRDDLPILIIIGEGERRKKLQQRINRYQLDDTIFLIGRVGEAEKYLKAFDIFTLTSITEALPYVLLEAGLAGLPIIASSVGGIPEIIDDMQNGILVRPKEPDEIQKALAYYLAKPEKGAIFGQNIQKKILTDFTKDTMVKMTLELYN